MRKLDDEWVLGLSDKQLAQWTLIHAKFQAHPLRLVQRFWRHQLGLEQVFGSLSTDDAELAEESFGMGEYTPLSFPDPARLTSMYSKLAKKLRDEIASGGSSSKTESKFLALGATALDADAHTQAGAALLGIEQAFLKRQYWEARAKQLKLSAPPVASAVEEQEQAPQIAEGFSPFSARFAPPTRKGAKKGTTGGAGGGDVAAAGAATQSQQDKAQALLDVRIAAIDAELRQCKAILMPVLQSLAVQDPGKYNQSRLRSIDDPSAYRNRIGGFADHAEWPQVEEEAEDLWALVRAQVYDESLRKNNRAAERYTPSAALDV